MGDTAQDASTGLLPAATQAAQPAHVAPALQDLVLEESYRSVDQSSHAINAAFAARDESQKSAAITANDEVLLLQNCNFPCDLKVVVEKGRSRKEEVAKLLGLDPALIELSCGSASGSSTTVKVEFVHPEDTSLFRPGNKGGEGNRKWIFSEEGAELVAGTLDGDRIMSLPSVSVNGVEIKAGEWLYFLRATAKASSVNAMIEDDNTTVALADWIHAPVPRAFQDVLNRDEKALSFFTEKSKPLTEEVVKSVAKLFQLSDQHLVRKNKSTNGLISDDDESVRSDAHANSSKQYLQDAMEAKAEVLALKAKLEAAHSTIKSLCDGDKEAKIFFDDTIKLVDDERRAKLAAQSELKQCKQDLAEAARKPSSKSLPRYRSEASDSPEPRRAHKRAKHSHRSHHKSSGSESDCESDYTKTKSPHCSKHKCK
eukprot:g14575.t1